MLFGATIPFQANFENNVFVQCRLVCTLSRNESFAFLFQVSKRVMGLEFSTDLLRTTIS